MPWVRVVKTIKGRSYAYLQRSFRDGGTVRTESRYLGPADSAADMPASGGSMEATPAPRVRNTSASGLRFRLSPESHHLSADRLHREYARIREWAQDLGVPPESFPSIALRDGKETRFRWSWTGNGMVVTVGRKDGRKAARKAFADAIGYAFLDSVRGVNPVAYEVLASRLDPSFRTTNHLLFTALASGGKQSRLALSLQIGWFGDIHRVKRKSAAALGLPSYGKRGGWEDEAAGIIGEIATQGYRKAVLSRVEATSKACRAEHAARRAFENATTFDRITGKRRVLGRKLVGATAARLATEEAQRKLHLITDLIPELTR